MAAFCTRCGIANQADAAFCDNCGAPLSRRPALAVAGDVPSAATATAPVAAAPPPGARKLAVGVGAAAVLLAVAATAAYLALRAPEPTASRLLAAAKAGMGAPELEQMKRQLCLANTDYRIDPFNVNPWDQRTQRWLNALVAAGLYKPPVPVQGGGLFAQNLLQYVPTAELQKYRDGSRLCVAKNAEVSEVVHIGAPVEQGSRGAMVSSHVVVQAVDAAPWLAKAEVRAVVLPELRDWEYKGDKLQRVVPQAFALRDGEWKLAPGMAEAPMRSGGIVARSTASHAPPSGGGLLASLSSLFSFGGHPLKGSWRLASTNVMGFELPAGLAPNLNFTADTVEIGGNTVPAKFEVDGKRVKVTLAGESAVVFVVEGADTMTLEGTGMRYQRTR